MNIPFGVSLQIFEQRRQIGARHLQRLVEPRIVHQSAHRAFPLVDAGHGPIQFAQRRAQAERQRIDVGLGQLLREPVQIGDHRREALEFSPSAVENFADVVDRRPQTTLFGRQHGVHIARNRVQVRQRPVDISLVVFQHGVDAFERDRQVVHHPRQTLLHVGQFGSGRRQHVARLGRHERVALRQQLRAVAHLDGVALPPMKPSL